MKQLKPDIQARPSPHMGSKGFVCPSKRNFIICEGEQSAKGLDLSIYNHPRFPHNGPEYIFDWLCMRGTVPSVVPDMCNADLGWTLKQEEEFNSAATLEGEGEKKKSKNVAIISSRMVSSYYWFNKGLPGN